MATKAFGSTRTMQSIRRQPTRRTVKANVASRKPHDSSSSSSSSPAAAASDATKKTSLWSQLGYSNLENTIGGNYDYCDLPPPWEVGTETAILESFDDMMGVFQRDAHEPEFLQAVREVLASVGPLLEKEPEKIATFRRILEPERVIMFRVPWIDDEGKQRVNRGFRVQLNSALGPYKGGLRFHPSVNLSILKFLAFEQAFKNALTGLPLGAGKGGADFDPKGKSDNEIMRFCQSYMTELCRHIGPRTDVPAGDIGVGGREIGYMYGQYKRIVGRFDAGVLTGKSMSFGGSNIRPEATGYGLVYFVDQMVTRSDIAPSLKGLRCALSGSGNVALFAAEKLLHFGAIPQTFSDSNGTLYCEKGFTEEDLEMLTELKNVKRGRLSELADVEGFEYFHGSKPWSVASFDAALPCATQNEVDLEDAEALVKSGVMVVAEGANMPSTPEAIAHFEENNVQFGPGKAANAGGVAVSGLEMAQNSMGIQWSREEVEERLRQIMVSIYDKCSEGSKMVDGGSLRMGADIMGFVRVAEAMEQQGLV